MPTFLQQKLAAFAFFLAIIFVYVCVQIARRRTAHQQKNPDAKLISLGIGDTTEPIPDFIVTAMRDAANGLGTLEGYSGYVESTHFILIFT